MFVIFCFTILKQFVIVNTNKKGDINMKRSGPGRPAKYVLSINVRLGAEEALWLTKEANRWVNMSDVVRYCIKFYMKKIKEENGNETSKNE